MALVWMTMSRQLWYAIVTAWERPSHAIAGDETFDLKLN